MKEFKFLIAFLVHFLQNRPSAIANKSFIFNQ